MALTETKFRFSKIVLSAAVFISLCVPTTAEVMRRCYWCGPLAEQVHRSQRAPSCSAPYSQVTVCDSGFPYCAIVATSPPYMESRYCVKLYQDECYTLYCNSTKTWRMTCPCRGDLCNGPNSDREEDAFTGLAKLVARTENTRIKRALISSSGFISMNTNRKNRIDNATIDENKNISNNLTDNSTSEEVNVKINENQKKDTHTSTPVDNINIENQMSDTTLSTVIDIKSDDIQISETSPTATLEVKNNDRQINNNNAFDDEVLKNNEHLINETNIQIDIPTVKAESSDLKTEIILMSSEPNKAGNDINANDVTTSILDVQTTTPEMKQTAMELKAMVETTTETVQTSPKDVKMNENKVKPTEQLPTAKALQHNETPATKTTEQNTMSTTVRSIQHTDVTTEANKPRNNTAPRLDAHILSLAIGIILQY